MHHPLPECGVMAKREPEHRDQQQQQRKKSKESAVGEHRRQPATVVVAVFLDHPKRKAQPAVVLLIAVHTPDGPLHRIHWRHPYDSSPAQTSLTRRRSPSATLPVTSRNKPRVPVWPAGGTNILNQVHMPPSGLIGSTQDTRSTVSAPSGSWRNTPT